MTTSLRKRALVRVPLGLIRQSIGLSNGILIHHTMQSDDDRLKDTVSLVLEGFDLPDSCITEEIPVPCVLQFDQTQSGLASYVCPVD